MGERWTAALAAYLERKPKTGGKNPGPTVTVMKPGAVEGGSHVVVPLPQFLVARNG